MATYTNLSLSRLANAALEGFVKELAPLRVFSTSFTPESIGNHRGNVVLVPLVGAITASTFASYALCGGTKSVVTITINRHKVAQVGQTDLDALGNSVSSLESFGYQQGQALAQCVVEDVLTLVTTANFASATAISSTVLDVAQLRSAKLLLDQYNAPKNGRVALLDCVAMDRLLAITNFVQAQMFADANVLREGKVRRALGFDLYELNSSFVAAASVLGFFGTSQAIAIAMRYLEPQVPSAYSNVQAYTDPTSGATFGLRDYEDPATGTRYVTLECNYGYSAGITNGARLVKRLD